MSNKRQSTVNLERVIGISIFSAFAYVVALVCNIIPEVAGFLSLDAKDAVIAIASFIYGPISGVIIALIAALIEWITFSTTAWYGFIMNFASSAVFALTASLIYKQKRTVNGALIALMSAILATTGVMLILNRFVTPLYLTSPISPMGGLPKEVANEMVLELLPKVLLPFNFAKSLLNASIAILLYKPVLAALSKAKIVKTKSASLSFNKNTKIILAIGSCALVVAIVIVLIIP